jgi:hypothetical protein
MAAVVPIYQPHAIAGGHRCRAAAIALAALAVTALIRLSGVAPGAEPAQDRLQPSGFIAVLRRAPIPRVSALAPEAFSRATCVMVLGENGKFSVGFEEPSGDAIVSLAACDLYNASPEARSTELLGAASLRARNIFLSGGFGLSPGAVMTASNYLATHVSPVVDPYAHLKVPVSSGCTRTGYRLDRQKTATISPGIYCGGIEVTDGAKLHLEPGTYILDRGNFEVSGDGTVSAIGVTLILTSRPGSDGGAIDIRARSTIEVTAPALGAAAGIPGIAIWADGRGLATTDTLEGGSTQNINGAIYLPGRQVKYTGGSPSATRCNQLIARAVAFTGNSYFRHDCTGAGLSEPDRPSLLAE